jgi:hypothetical protein
MKRFLPTVFLLATIQSGCSASPKPFDSKRWKSGNPSSRGAMTQDFIERRVLAGRSQQEIQELLGPPDEQDSTVYGYKVVTIARCHFWKCELDVVFDKNSNRVNSVGVSD